MPELVSRAMVSEGGWRYRYQWHEVCLGTPATACAQVLNTWWLAPPALFPNHFKRMLQANLPMGITTDLFWNAASVKETLF